MPFLRFSRDKRGVESFALVHSTTNRRGKVRPRVLYWFRSPPDIKVGREPFDPEVRRALEQQHPDITFDWRAIAETPIPSADADKWRERRRAERAAKHAAKAEESAEADGADADADAGEGETNEPAAAPNGEADVAADADNAGDSSLIASEPARDSASEPGISAATPAAGAPRTGDPNRNRRRRRSGGRGGNPPGAGRPASTPPSGGGDPSGD